MARQCAQCFLTVSHPVKPGIMYLTDENDSNIPTANLGKETLPFIAALPDARSYPHEGADELGRLKAAKIIQVGTTTPGHFEGGGLLIDYINAQGEPYRLILAFTELGMWVEEFQPLSI